MGCFRAGLGEFSLESIRSATAGPVLTGRAPGLRTLHLHCRALLTDAEAEDDVLGRWPATDRSLDSAIGSGHPMDLGTGVGPKASRPDRCGRTRDTNTVDRSTAGETRSDATTPWGRSSGRVVDRVRPTRHGTASISPLTPSPESLARWGRDRVPLPVDPLLPGDQGRPTAQDAGMPGRTAPWVASPSASSMAPTSAALGSPRLGDGSTWSPFRSAVSGLGCAGAAFEPDHRINYRQISPGHPRAIGCPMTADADQDRWGLTVRLPHPTCQVPRRRDVSRETSGPPLGNSRQKIGRLAGIPTRRGNLSSIGPTLRSTW